MKKKKLTLNKLSLNKNLISNLQGNSVIGGGITNDRGWTCPHDASVYSNCNGVPEPIDPTSRPTVNTLELSHCVTIQGVPPTCISVYPCA